MDKLDEGATLGQMKTLLSETRSRLSEAFQEAAEVGVWDSDDEVDELYNDRSLKSTLSLHLKTF
jgi:hypothetical protein